MASSSSSGATSGGVSFAGLLFLLFLGLKLGKVIDWSWWWVTSPLWIPFAFVIAILVIAGIIVGIASIFK